MIFTEEEAAERWCPFSRVPFNAEMSAAAVNRDRNGDIAKSACCIGSACMAWRTGKAEPSRWSVKLKGKTEVEVYTWDPRVKRAQDSSDYYHGAEIEEIKTSVRGYCGLAGGRP